MCYVYDDHGVYELGGVSYGEESAIKVSPQSKGAQDALMRGLDTSKVDYPRSPSQRRQDLHRSSVFLLYRHLS